jgi:hypothetical protein
VVTVPSLDILVTLLPQATQDILPSQDIQGIPEFQVIVLPLDILDIAVLGFLVIVVILDYQVIQGMEDRGIVGIPDLVVIQVNPDTRVRKGILAIVVILPYRAILDTQG